MAGRLYKTGIPIFPEKQIPELIDRYNVDYVYLSYSDLSHQEVMTKGSLVLSHGSNFSMLGTYDTYLHSKKPVIAVTAVRTGVGKSRVSRSIAIHLRSKNKKVIAIRHPMPYGNLKDQSVQKFYTPQDLIKAKVTIEEREEYEHYLREHMPIFAGVDYKAILKEAEKEADLILWDGGNNDTSFIKPDLYITMVDPRRVGHELTYYPGQVNLRLADIILIHKMTGTTKENLKTVHENIKKVNKKARVIEVNPVIIAEEPHLIKGKRVLLIGDGPTMTHGGMAYGIANAVADKYKAKSVVDAERYAVGSIKKIYEKFPHLKKVLPAMGYSKKQVKELQESINRAECDLVIDGTPSDLKKLFKINKKVLYAGYDINKKDLVPVYKKIDLLLK